MTADRARHAPDALAVWEPHIRAFVALCPDGAVPGSGPLAGLSAGIKDNIDVAGVPTRNGSATCAQAAPAPHDAAVVAALRRAGARIVGKTVTTEFAFTDPTDCRNPHDTARSPGGSSSGSGAAVASGVVDFALGTQTAGSLCRPAAYCGAVGFKPGYGALPMAGVTPLAPGFDTVGVIARSVSVARAAFAAMRGDQRASAGTALSTATWLIPGTVRPAPDMQRALREAKDILTSFCRAGPAPAVTVDSALIVAAHRTVMLAEAAQAHADLMRPDTARLLRPKFRAALRAGMGIGPGELSDARRYLQGVATRFWAAMDATDIILTLPVPEGAPLIGDSTGFQDWLTVWTVLGGPLVSLPWGMDRLGRPCAVMLAARPGAEDFLLHLAQRLEQAAPSLPAPTPPATPPKA